MLHRPKTCFARFCTNCLWGDKAMKKRESYLRIDPESRLVPLYDAVSIRKFRTAERGEMGIRVVDDCAETHIQ